MLCMDRRTRDAVRQSEIPCAGALASDCTKRSGRTGRRANRSEVGSREHIRPAPLQPVCEPAIGTSGQAIGGHLPPVTPGCTDQERKSRNQLGEHGSLYCSGEMQPPAPFRQSAVVLTNTLRNFHPNEVIRTADRVLAIRPEAPASDRSSPHAAQAGRRRQSSPATARGESS